MEVNLCDTLELWNHCWNFGTIVGTLELDRSLFCALGWIAVGDLLVVREGRGAL